MSNRHSRQMAVIAIIAMSLNYVVAWGAILLGRTLDPEPQGQRISEPRWPLWGKKEWPNPASQIRTATWWIDVDRVTHDDPRSRFSGTFSGRGGLPFRSLQWRSTGAYPENPASPVKREIAWGIRFQRGHSFYLSVFPMRPIWAGFAVNTAIYGACLYLFISLRRSFTQRICRKRGLCSFCRYPTLKGAKACTECGNEY